MKIIGTRILKTGIAVTITMYLCGIFNLEPVVFGAVSAVINMQPSLYLTFKTARDQVAIHVLGAVVGLVFGYLAGGNPVVMGVVTVSIIFLYNKLKLQHGILMGVVAAVFILSAPPDQFMIEAFNRTLVIFTGLVVAMVVNAVLCPPRYGRLFVQKLREANENSAAYFCRSVQDFVRLENQAIPVPKDDRMKAVEANEKCRVLSGYYRTERGALGDSYDSTGTNGWYPQAEKFMTYNEELVEKGDRIYGLLNARLDRRIRYGAMPISKEFRAMLSLLAGSCLTINRVNDKLRLKICDREPVEQEDISEKLWDELMAAIEKWQPMLTDSYYLHGLIEVASVAGDIRWAARKGKKLLNLSA